MDEMQEAGGELFHKGQYGTFGIRRHDADINESAEGNGSRRTSFVGYGGCERRVQQRAGPGGAGCGSGVNQEGVCQWLNQFFRPQQFDVEWDGKVRGSGSANGGHRYPPVVFLI